MVPSIILVDDSELDRYIARRVISEIPDVRRTVEYDDGEPVLELLQNDAERQKSWGDPPYLVLLDIKMKRVDGFRVLEAMERSPGVCGEAAGLHVVVLTSSSNTSDVARAQHFPFVKDYIVKPLPRSRLASIVAACSSPGDPAASGAPAKQSHDS